LIFWPTPGSTCLIFWWLIAGDWTKVPFDDQRHRSSNEILRRHGPIFLGVINLHLSLIFHSTYPSPTSHMPCLA
jgi:hypothetical protein